MALSDLWSRRKPEPESTQGSTTSTLAEMTTTEFEDMLKEYNLVEVNDEPGQQFAIVAPASQSDPMVRELGTTSPSPWTSFNRREYNPKLQGLMGLREFDKMRKSDGTVRGTLRLFKTPVLAASWFMEPGGIRKMDRTASDFAWKALTEYMSISFTQVLTESLLMCDFGFYIFEKVWDNRIVDGKMRTVLKKLAPRHPMDVEAWEFDDNGGPMGAWFYGSPETVHDWQQGYLQGMGSTQTVNMPGGMNVPVPSVSGIPGLNVEDHPQSVFISIDKLVVFTFDKEAGDIEGTSVLRSAYKHWYYKEQLYKIDAIQKERHGIGIPIIKLPMGYKEDDKRAAEELGRNIRTNERAHIVLPPGWDVSMLKLEGSPMDCLPSIEHHDHEIEKNITAYFLGKGGQGAATSILTDVFLKASRFLADIVAETFSMYLLPQLIAYNFPTAAAPKLNYRHIGDTVDWRTMSFAIRNFIGAGVIKPDDVLETNIRAEMGLPAADPSTTREVAAPQAGPNAGQGTGTKAPGAPNPPKPPRTGPPRQAPVGKQRNTQGLPKGNAGVDRSGG